MQCTRINVRARRISVRPTTMYEEPDWQRVFRQAADDSFVAIGRDPIAHLAMDYRDVHGDPSSELCAAIVRDAARSISRAHRFARAAAKQASLAKRPRKIRGRRRPGGPHE